VRPVVALLALTLVLAGCSRGDEPAPRPDPSATATSSPTVSASAGCGSVPDDVTATSRDVTRRLDVDATQRQYVVHVPQGYDGRTPLPVVYLFHGKGSSAVEVSAYSAFPNAADEHDFILVAPQATGNPSTWDVLTPPTTPGSDAAFWVDLTRTLGDEFCIDPDQQYATGMSNGSAVVFAMACSQQDYPFRAYAGVAATFYDQDGCGAAPPRSILYFHGTGDEVVPYDGGATPLFPVRAVPAVMADWAQHDGCDATPSTRDVASDVQRETWRGCDDGTRLEAYTIDGGGHTWPGADIEVPVLGRTTTSIDATDLIVDFFGLGGR
jgi:polyhydroxybutyrate depolymerase